MGAPCINDTCSISSQVDPVTRRLQLDVNINSQRGLSCVDGSGVGLLIYGNPAAEAPVDTCFQQLGVDPTLGAWSIPKRAKIHSFSGSVVNIPQGSSEGNDSLDSVSSGGTILNPHDCQAMMLVVGRYEIGYTVSYTDAPAESIGATISSGGNTFVPFNADIRARLALNGTNKDVAFFDIGGTVLGSGTDSLNNSNKRIWQDFVFVTTIGANASVTVEAFANHEGNNESVNISTVQAFGPAFADRGFRVVGNAIIMPFNSEATP